MSDENISGAQPIPQTGEAAWFPPVEDDAEARDMTQPPTVAQPPQKDVRWLSIGKDGLRAGWSALLYLLIVFLLGVGVSQVLKLLHHRPASRAGGMSASSTLIGEGISFAVVALAGFCVSLVERRSFALYGIGSLRGRMGQFATGALWGAALLSTLVLLLASQHLLVFTGVLMGGAQMLQWGLVWAAAFLLVGLFEEFLTRGFLQFTVARGVARGQRVRAGRMRHHDGRDLVHAAAAAWLAV